MDTYRDESRLNREFGRDEAYAMEELVAELGAVFLSADHGLKPEVRGSRLLYHLLDQGAEERKTRDRQDRVHCPTGRGLSVSVSGQKFRRGLSHGAPFSP
ncbi:zincin-like metallopeptidase domain-containing protein [Bradyrhizobium arachidis]|uniref:zincin-like metallopeptidase domain-containing protein n=1 Tax=Bradyrhizobium TaxID=374 RepID=UPI0024BF6F87|nr:MULTISPECIES: zincin-like metallopeptidase domain-containing protein [Bradyrhizobium]